MVLKLRLLSTLLFLAMGAAFAQIGTGTLKGSVIDETGEPVPFAPVSVKSGEKVVTGASTDFDGKFNITGIPPGTYDVEIVVMGYSPYKKTGVQVSSDKITFLDNQKISEGETLDDFVVEAYSKPLIDRDGGASGGSVSKEEITKMPVRSATSIAATVGGVAKSETGEVSVRGQRSSGTFYYIDGIKVRGSVSLPKDAIQEVSVITGGLPANYGDATGGIISITTTGPRAVYFGGIEWLTSGLKFGDNIVGFDKYGYNLLEATLSGPLLMKKDSLGNKKDPIVGFLLSANFNHQVDPRPVFGGTYSINDDVAEGLLTNPLRRSSDGNAVFYNTDYLTADDISRSKTRKNAASLSASGAAKFDFNTGANTNLSISASGNYFKASQYSYSGSLLNSDNFGVGTGFDWRTSARFSHKLLAKNTDGLFKGASYNISVDYSQTNRSNYDKEHEGDIFKYGYIGSFDQQRERSYSFDSDRGIFVQDGWAETELVFTPSEENVNSAAITSQYYSLFDNPAGRYQNFNQVIAGNALVNGQNPLSVYDIWSNVGTRYNTYFKSNTNQLRVTASGMAYFGDHTLTLGFEYEQRKDRNHGVSPVGLWTIMRQLTNAHIKELDENLSGTFQDGTYTYEYYDRLYSADDHSTFDKRLRAAVGYDQFNTNFINVDALDPSIFGLGMFSADELLNNGNNLVSYYGYDYQGNILKGAKSLNDFFTERDEEGVLTRPVAAFEPVYMAGFIMDKFSFDDITFNVGVRVDRFDANQSVLSDPYLFARAKTAGSLSAADMATLNNAVIPSSIGDDYVVYVDDVKNPTGINGFRNGDVWYNASGEEVNDPSVLQGAEGIAPFLVDNNELDNNRLQSDVAFEDYKPQINIMPRISFSFNISEEAVFFAHYDILTQRPLTGARLDPIDYYLINERTSSIVNNPNLKPEKTIDYEFGFQQVLGRTSSLKISAFYREQRDQIQVVKINQAYPVSYLTYGNIDFGTVKGITLTYDLRRTKNITLNASYTLQFADGTGSDANSGINLAASGEPNLRTIFPYDFDQRHKITIRFDYRYGDGDNYNGPRIGEAKIFKNTGLNLQGLLYSGNPYTQRQRVTPRGLINGSSSAPIKGTKNGSRLPWSFRLDLMVDRDFFIAYGKDKSKSSVLNVYFQINNLLNSQNVISLYEATGSTSDDGYLTSAQYQNQIQAQNNEATYRMLYAYKVDNPFNLGIPRTIRLGFRYSF